MSVSDILIRLGADFTGRGAFDQAKKSTTELEKAVGKLSRQFAAVFSAYKIAQFGKDSVRAFATSQKQAAQLGSTIKSLGLAFAAPEVNKYISELERLSGINREVLQPSFQQLLTQTGSIAKSQKILSTAIAVSKSGVMSLEEASSALSQAFVGNTKGIKQFNIGLTNAEISTMTFDQLLQKISATYKDQYAASLDLVATKMDKLTIATNKFKEGIGKGLVDAFANLVGNGDIDKATAKIEALGTTIGNVISRVTSKGWLAFMQWLNPATVGNFESGKTDYSNLTGAGDYQRLKAQAALKAKAEKDALARAKALADAIKKQQAEQAKLLKQKQDAIKLDELSLRYKKAEAIFDMDKIEIAAAMLGKQTAEDYARLKLKSDLIALQDAINSKDVAAATALAAIVEDDYKRVQAYQAVNIALGLQTGLITNVEAAAKLIPEDLNLINLDNLQSAIGLINQMINSLNTLSTKTQSASAAVSSGTAATSYAKANTKIDTSTLAGIAAASGMTVGTLMGRVDTSTLQGIANASQIPLNTMMGKVDTSTLAGVLAASAGTAPVINITVTDNAQKLVDVIMDTTQQQSANGISTRIIRNTGNLAW